MKIQSYIYENNRTVSRSAVQQAGKMLSGMNLDGANPGFAAAARQQRKLLKASISQAAKMLTLATREKAREVIGADQKPRMGRPHGQPSGPMDPNADGGAIHLPRNIRWRRLEGRTSFIGRMQTVGTADIYAASVEYGHLKVLWGRRTNGRVGGPSKNIRRSFWRRTIDVKRRDLDSIVLGNLRKNIKKLQGR